MNKPLSVFNGHPIKWLKNSREMPKPFTKQANEAPHFSWSMGGVSGSRPLVARQALA